MVADDEKQEDGNFERRQEKSTFESMSGQGKTDEYNFCFPIDLKKLEASQLKLVPFDSNLGVCSQLYVALTSTPSAVSNFDYLPYGPFQSQDDFLDWYGRIQQPSKAVVWLAIFVNRSGMEAIKQTKGDDAHAWEQEVQAGAVDDSCYAGSIGLLNADVANASCEIGHINILPTFQRTFVGTHANSLLLSYLLEPESTGCLQLRRVQWHANASNRRSVAAAQRLGFRLEGILRWHRILPEGKLGKKVDGGGRGPGRDSALLSVCWDDWRDSVRDRVKDLMAR